ncbi:MAG: hypothetical protein ACE5HV_02015, partial [Acidobacteriota bacterium]
VLIPMHYRIPELEPSEGKPEGLGPIDPWLSGKDNVVRLGRHRAKFSLASVEGAEQIVVFSHSSRIPDPRPPR